MKNLKGLSCILLIDDEEINNYLHKLMIERLDLDLHVQSTLNGNEALEYITCTGKYADFNNYPQPGIILLDINMPKMNGWEFLQEYEKLSEEKRDEIVVVMLTASINPDDQRKALSYDTVADYVNKPLTIDNLRELIYKHYEEA